VADCVAKVEILASQFFRKNEANSNLKLKLTAAASDMVIQKIQAGNTVPPAGFL